MDTSQETGFVQEVSQSQLDTNSPNVDILNPELVAGMYAPSTDQEKLHKSSRRWKTSAYKYSGSAKHDGQGAEQEI
jgi:hypothetical protein